MLDSGISVRDMSRDLMQHSNSNILVDCASSPAQRRRVECRGLYGGIVYLEDSISAVHGLAGAQKPRSLVQKCLHQISARLQGRGKDGSPGLQSMLRL